jgi:hypothetical protein
MAAHDAWALVCRLFAGGTPVLRNLLSPSEVAVLSVLGKAVKPTTVDQSFVLCPHCQQHRLQVWGDGRGGRMCRCPDCGSVPVEVADGAALALDEVWLRKKIRLALGIESRDSIDDLGDGVWRLGDARRSPVLLVRDPTRVLREPALLDRVSVRGGDIRLITPNLHGLQNAAFGVGVYWLPLEERFAFYGDGVSFMDLGVVNRSPEPSAPGMDPTVPVHGPFSEDFRWVTLPNGSEAIRCTDAQAEVFKALWLFKGEEVTAEQIMFRANLKSDKPIDVFKAKAHADPKRAYQALVITQRRAGLYSMPCAKRVSG